MQNTKILRRAARTLILAGALFTVACTAGPEGQAGPSGPPGPRGDAGEAGAPGVPVPALSGEIEGKVTAVSTGEPLAGVAVSSPGAALSATTAAGGTFSVPKLPAGVYVLTLTRAGYVTQTVPGVSVGANGTTHVTISLATDTTSSDGLAVVVQDNVSAGYGSAVTLTAHVTATDGDAGGVTYAWTQTGGSPAALTGASTASLSFRTLSLASAKLEANPSAVLGPYDGGALVPARFGPMAIGIDETGNYQFALTVADAAGHTATTSAIVWATAPTSGLRSVPFNVPVWLEGDSVAADGGAMTTWSWVLSAPSGSQSQLAQASTPFPSFTPDRPGSYSVTETVSGHSTSIYASGWDGVSGIASQPGSGTDYVVQGCTAQCHMGSVQFPNLDLDGGAAPDMFPPWAATPHAGAFADGIDGVLGPAFGPSCLQCHTLGYSPVARGNGGFDDEATKDGWTFPATLDAGNYAALVATQPDLAQRGGVQCESCHGPKNLDVMGVDDTAAVSFGEGVCSQCHSQGDQWKGSLHADLQVAIEEGSTTGPAPANCGRCHSAQGFAVYTEELLAGCTAAGSGSCLLTSNGAPPADGGANAPDGASFARIGLAPATVQPLTCAACHDPHGIAGNPYQLRVFDTATLMNGLSVSGVGAGAVCMVCHNSRPAYPSVGDGAVIANGLSSASPLITPHNGTQADVLYGANAYFMPSATPSPHLAVGDTCAGCHERIPNAAETDAGQTSNHSFIADLSICKSCHAAAFDGASVQTQTQAQMAQLDTAIFEAIGTLLSAAGTYNTTVRDARTLDYLCVAGGGTPSVYLPITSVPATYAPFTVSAGPPVHTVPWRSLSSVEVTFASNPFAAIANLAECGSTSAPSVVPGVTYQGGPVVISVSSAQAGATHATSNLPLVSAVSITGKSIYNEALLNNDLSMGVHNLPFTQAVITSTLAELASVTAGNP